MKTATPQAMEKWNMGQPFEGLGEVERKSTLIVATVVRLRHHAQHIGDIRRVKRKIMLGRIQIVSVQALEQSVAHNAFQDFACLAC